MCKINYLHITLHNIRISLTRVPFCIIERLTHSQYSFINKYQLRQLLLYVQSNQGMRLLMQKCASIDYRHLG